MLPSELQAIVTRVTGTVADAAPLTEADAYAIGTRIGAELRLAGASEGEIGTWLGTCARRHGADALSVAALELLAEGAGYTLRIQHLKQRITLQRIRLH